MVNCGTPVDPTLALKIRRTESLTSLVRRELERMIEMGELAGGDRLNENALATRLGVSRGPIREACRGLEQSGLVEVVVNRGVFVRELDNKAAAELYDIRASLMGMAGRLLAPIITTAQAAELQALINDMDKAAKAEDLNAFYPLNLRFHEKIVGFTGNERLLSLCNAIQREAHLFRRRTLDAPGRMKVSNAEHRRILAALKKHDAEASRREMEEHVLTSKDALFGK
ncbi:GntR family transcriptional regulator [Alsobacter metallidurans]|uniref:GntR family transcriptional regulator n=1 Tax=Alsobacter metallidurans TaxID=340221 RepID=A0A917MFN2_9HYPH|nr:GntR family transcriptional regulator [Alsobacter metallidurans]